VSNKTLDNLDSDIALRHAAAGSPRNADLIRIGKQAQEDLIRATFH
jgi:hypothetical protein